MRIYEYSENQIYLAYEQKLSSMFLKRGEQWIKDLQEILKQLRAYTDTNKLEYVKDPSCEHRSWLEVQNARGTVLERFLFETDEATWHLPDMERTLNTIVGGLSRFSKVGISENP